MEAVNGVCTLSSGPLARRRHVAYPVVDADDREARRYAGALGAGDPCGHHVALGTAVVVARTQEVRDLESRLHAAPHRPAQTELGIDMATQTPLLRADDGIGAPGLPTTALLRAVTLVVRRTFGPIGSQSAVTQRSACGPGRLQPRSLASRAATWEIRVKNREKAFLLLCFYAHLLASRVSSLVQSRTGYPI